MQITVENISFEPTRIEKATLSNSTELKNLIGGDITITVGEYATTYDEVSVVDFSLVLAEAIVKYLSTGSDRISFWAPDFQDGYVIKVTGGSGLTCEIFKNGELLSDRESLLEIIESMRPFIAKAKALVEERYGHIEFIWDVLSVPVF